MGYFDVQLNVLVGVNMNRIRLNEDIQPLSEFRSGVSAYIKHVNETHRPLLLTQRGKGVAVVLDVTAYEAMQEKIELFEEIKRSESQIANGLGVDNEDVRQIVLKRLKK